MRQTLGATKSLLGARMHLTGRSGAAVRALSEGGLGEQAKERADGDEREKRGREAGGLRECADDGWAGERTEVSDGGDGGDRATPTAISPGAKAANPIRNVRRLPSRATSAAPVGRPTIAPASSPRMPSASAPADRSSSALMAGSRVAHAAGSHPAVKKATNVARRAERSRAESIATSGARPFHDDTSGCGIVVLSCAHAGCRQARDAARSRRARLILRGRPGDRAHATRGLAAGLAAGAAPRHPACAP